MSLQTQEHMSGKEKRMAKAVRLHYMEDMSYTEIAKELGLSKSTVKKYFADDQVKQLRRYFSDQEKYELQRAVEQDLWDKEQIANECVGKAKQLADSSRAYNQTAKTAMNTVEKKVKLLQELGVIQKPKERKEVEQKDSGPASVSVNMELVESEEEVEQDDG